MKAYEAIKRLKADRKEFLEQYGIKSHMSKISPELEAELFGEEKKINEARPETTETTDSAETIILGEPSIDTESEQRVKEIANDYVDAKECPYTLEEIELGIRCLGGKAQQYKWRHLLNG